MNFALIVFLAGLMQSTKSFRVGGEWTTSGTSLALGYVLLSAFFAGRIFKQAHMPKLTGYLFAGLMLGPHVLGLVSSEMFQSLRLVNGMAIALIALTAGTEMEFHSMKPVLRTVRWITVMGVLGTVVLLTGTVWLSRDLLPFMATMPTVEALSVSLVLAIVMVAQSPAVVVALRSEMQAEGPVSRTVLGVVILADMVVILLFACASSVAKAVMLGEIDMFSTLYLVTWELLGSLVMGAAVGLVLAAYIRHVQDGAEMFLLATTFAVAEVGQHLGLDPLLIALAAGVLIRNATSSGPRLLGTIDASSMPVYILFFAVAGGNLQIDTLAIVGIPALLFVAVRAFGLLVGSNLGARIAGAPEMVCQYAGFGLVPQAGLALALAMLFAKSFPEFGKEAGALVLAVVAINELVAPVLYRLALVRSGETGRLPSPSQRNAEPDLPMA